MNHLITGANRGIGLEFVRRLTARGDHVVATARRPEEARALQALASEHPERVEVVALDVTDAGSCEALGERLSGRAIDVLINNAGILERGGALGRLDYEALRRCFEVNTLGPLRVVEAALEALRRGEGRKIVNVTSKMGSIEDNTGGGSYAYRASKTALNMVTRSLSIDLEGEGFTVFVIHPGWVQTDMGGANAQIDTDTSVSGMLEVIDGAGRAQRGAFLEWNGDAIPW